MLTPDTLAQLSPQDRAARLELEAVAHYGGIRYKAQIARDFGLARSTITTWKDRPELIPAGVILALAAWNYRKRELTEISAVIWNRAADLKQLAEGLDLPPRP
jgi:transposase